MNGNFFFLWFFFNIDRRKIKLWIEDVEGRHCRTSFYGMDITRDRLCKFIKKWQSLIEAHCEVKTQDGYSLRMFCIAFTKKDKNQIRKTTYAQQSQIKAIRKKMVETLTKEAASNSLTNLVQTLITDSLGDAIKQECKLIFPLDNVLIRKVKLIKKPKFDVGKLTELYSEQKTVPEKVEATGEVDEESKNLLTK